MKERPILFSGEMVRAILDGRKTMTRRVIQSRSKNHPEFCLIDYDGNGLWPYQSDDGESSLDYDGNEIPIGCPYGQPGDLLWVRETWTEAEYDQMVIYRADCDAECEEARKGIGYRWHPSIHMPRWASRLTLRVTGVRVERVQEISTEDQIAEGLSTRLREHDAVCDLREQWIALWDSINAKRGYGWDVNPWVWVVSFERVEATHA